MIIWGKSSFHGTNQKPENVLRKNKNIKKVALGEQSSCLLFEDGSIASDKMSGDCDQSENEAIFKDSQFLDLFGGSKHTFALDDKRKLYGWGSNDEGQLGIESETEVLVPKPLSFSEKVVQVSCGQSHSLLLTMDSLMYSMGNNTYNQLGVGTLPNNAMSATQPILLDSLAGVPISHIAAGGWHSFCVTSSGRLFSWGRNEYGQLGLGDNVNHKYPNFLKSLNQSLAFVAAGLHHSVILTKTGQVLTFGLGSSGQLGHEGSNDNESSPKIVEELRGSIVTQIACGFNHTVVFVPDFGHIFVFGDNAEGQLGVNKSLKPTITNPEIVKLPETCHKVVELVATGNQTVVLHNEKSSSLDFRHIEPHRCIASLDESFTDKILQLTDGETDVDIIEQLCYVMNSQSCLNGCFTAQDQMTTNDNPGVDLTVAKSVFAIICQSGNGNLRDAIITCLSKNLLPSLIKQPRDIEALKLYIFLPFLLELFQEPEFIKIMYFPFIKSILHLHNSARKILNRWYKCIGSDFCKIIKLCCLAIGFLIDIQEDVKSESMQDMLKFIKELYDLNAKSGITGDKDFYLSCKASGNFLWKDYVSWKSNLKREPIFLSHSFMFDTKMKSLLFHISAKYKKEVVNAKIHELNFFRLMGLNFDGYPLPITKIEVDRKSLVSDAIRQLQGINDLQTLFQVSFKGEEGMDDGALSKEFFMLALQEVLDPDSGIFSPNEDSNLVWFSDFDHDFESIYNFVGVLCGLALFNDAIINVHFPLAMYKKLLSKEPDLEDLKEFNPFVGNSLQQLLDFEEEDDLTFEEVFDLCFTFSNGESLKENGDSINVTMKNRSEYVRLYINYVFNDSVKVQFDAFYRGFQKVCNSELLDLFSPKELREVVAGEQDFDWREVEARMMKPGQRPFSPDANRVIVWFWEVLHSFTKEEQEEFLLFLTGSSNVPITGLSMAITCSSRVEDDTFLPVAVTCYNSLQLHFYSSKEILEERLKLSIKCKGFHKA